MFDQTFSTKNLRSILKKRDFISFKLIKKDQIYVKCIESISSKIESGQFFCNSFKKSIITKKIIYIGDSLHNVLVLRKVNDSIRRLYKLTQVDRISCVKRISTILEDTIPIFVLKIDIKDFYESIDMSILLKKLYGDHLLSYQSKQALRELFLRDEFSDLIGLPRGLSISSSLSELYMRNLDRYISGLNGVYFYSRFVDDIIVFSHIDSNDILDSVKKFIETELSMKLNDKKTRLLKINCDCKKLCKCSEPKKCKLQCECSNSGNLIEFDYLGYSFIIPKIKNKKEPCKPIISISKSKINKYKNRICLSFLDFCKTKDFDLLKKRIKFLTGNFYVDPMDKEKNLKAGIYYNYQLINDTNALVHLDEFYRKVLFAHSGTLGTKLKNNLKPYQRRSLVKYSFSSGFKNKILHKFSRENMSSIKECWK